MNRGPGAETGGHYVQLVFQGIDCPVQELAEGGGAALEQKVRGVKSVGQRDNFQIGLLGDEQS